MSYQDNGCVAFGDPMEQSKKNKATRAYKAEYDRNLRAVKAKIRGSEQVKRSDNFRSKYQ